MVILQPNKNGHSLHTLFTEIFNVTPDTFEEVTLKVFNYQYLNIAIYRNYCDLIKKTPQNVSTIQEIPFLPISLFKKHKLLDGVHYEVAFTSSGTSGNQTSTHFLKDTSVYEKSFTSCFEQFYGDIKDFSFFALLPSYLERKGSSLIYMVDYMIKHGKPSSGFYLYNTEELIQDISARSRVRSAFPLR